MPIEQATKAETPGLHCSCSGCICLDCCNGLCFCPSVSVDVRVRVRVRDLDTVRPWPASKGSQPEKASSLFIYLLSNPESVNQAEAGEMDVDAQTEGIFIFSSAIWPLVFPILCLLRGFSN